VDSQYKKEVTENDIKTASERFIFNTKEIWKNDFQKIMNQQEYTDFVFKLEDLKLCCHRAVLCGHTLALRELVSTKSELELEDVSIETVKLLLSYLYYGNEEIDPISATQLVLLSNEFKISGLVNICEEIIRKSIRLDTVLNILQVACDPIQSQKNAILKFQCLDFIVKNFANLDLEPLQKMHPIVAAEVVVALQASIGINWKIKNFDVFTDFDNSILTSNIISFDPRNNEVNNEIKRTNQQNIGKKKTPRKQVVLQKRKVSSVRDINSFFE